MSSWNNGHPSLNHNHRHHTLKISHGKNEIYLFFEQPWMIELLAYSDWSSMTDSESGGWRENGYECGKRKWNKSKQEKWKKNKKEVSGGGGGGCAGRAVRGKWWMWVFWAVSGVGEMRKKWKMGKKKWGVPTCVGVWSGVCCRGEKMMEKKWVSDHLGNRKEKN